MVVLYGFILKSVKSVICDLFTTDMDVISNECKNTLANPVSRRNYMECLQQMREQNLTENNFVDYDGEVKTIIKFH